MITPRSPFASSGSSVNMPAAGLNSFNAGNFSFILFNRALTQFLNLEISALEADGKGKTISSPRVLTADRKFARAVQASPAHAGRIVLLGE